MSGHWDDVYAQRAPEKLSWFQPHASLSLEFIDAMQLPQDTPLLDVGAGASLLVDGLLERGFGDVSLLDVSAHALEVTRHRLEPRAVETIVADVTAWQPARRYGLWHDRAVFHFLTQQPARDAYRSALASALAERAHVIVATFALDGPERCSGQPVQRYGVEELADEFSELLRLVGARRERHVTPTGVEQPFVYAHFVRR
jgi:trans-aconitate methyltransferase